MKTTRRGFTGMVAGASAAAATSGAAVVSPAAGATAADTVLSLMHGNPLQVLDVFQVANLCTPISLSVSEKPHELALHSMLFIANSCRQIENLQQHGITLEDVLSPTEDMIARQLMARRQELLDTPAGDFELSAEDHLNGLQYDIGKFKTRINYGKENGATDLRSAAKMIFRKAIQNSVLLQPEFWNRQNTAKLVEIINKSQGNFGFITLADASDEVGYILENAHDLLPDVGNRFFRALYENLIKLQGKATENHSLSKQKQDLSVENYAGSEQVTYKLLDTWQITPDPADKAYQKPGVEVDVRAARLIDGGVKEKPTAIRGSE